MPHDSSPILFLVHGVGNTASGEMETAVRSCYSGMGQDDICEVVWNRVRDSIVLESPDEQRDESKPRERDRLLLPSLALLKLSELTRISKSIHSALQAVRQKAAGGAMPRRMEKLYAFLNRCWMGGMVAITSFPLTWIGWNNTICNLAANMGVELPGIPSETLKALVVVGGMLSCLSLVGDAVLTGAAITRRGGIFPSGAMAAASVLLLRVLSALLIALLPVTVLVNLEVFLLRMLILVSKGFKKKAQDELEPSAGYVFLLVNTFALWGLALFEGWGGSPIIISVLLVMLPIFHAVLGAIVKVLGDIFHYATDVAYRERILQYFHDRVVRTMKRSRSRPSMIIIASHSLGTVIALDFLWNHGHIISDLRLVLLTGGSPIKRFFQRFFPKLFFPETTKDCAVGLARRFPKGFSWHNFYRPLDYIGTNLGLPKTEGCSEDKVFRLLRLHTNYWGDRAVAKRVRQRLNEPPYKPTREDLATPETLCDTPFDPLKAALVQPQRPSPASRWLLLSVLLAFVISAVSFTATTVRSRFKEFDHIQQLISHHDLPSLAASVRRSETSHFLPSDGTEFTHPVYTFEYENAAGVTVTMQAREDLFGNRSAPVVLCDHSKLEHLAARRNQTGGSWTLQGIRLAGPIGAKGDFLAIDLLPGRPTILSIIAGSFFALFLFGFVSVLGFFVLAYWIMLIIQLTNGGIGLPKFSAKAHS